MRKAIATAATPAPVPAIVDVEEIQPGCIKWRVGFGGKHLGDFGNPFFDGARALLALGHNPGAPYAMRHAKTGTIGMRWPTVGDAARWEVGGRPWRLVEDRERRQAARDARAAAGQGQEQPPAAKPGAGKRKGRVVAQAKADEAAKPAKRTRRNP